MNDLPNTEQFISSVLQY